MPSIISRLNCFSKKKSGTDKKQKKRSYLDTDEEDGDGVDFVQSQLMLAPTRSNSTHQMENSDSPTGSTLSNLASLAPRLNINHRDPYDNDDNSIPTMDSDYNKVQSGAYSVSDAGGTFDTQGQSLTNFSQAASSAFGSAAPSPFGAEPPSLGAGHHDYSRSMQLPNVGRGPPGREEILEIYAPAGKLGVVIDAPPDSATPVVHAIKDTCPIRDQIYVGDRLVAVDDVDVREMDAGAVSRCISKKSGQERRKLTIVRTTRGRDGMY